MDFHANFRPVKDLRMGHDRAGSLAVCTIIAMFCLPLLAKAADIVGKVQGANRPISGSTVTLYAAGAGAPVQLAQSKSDENGAFKLSVSRAPAEGVLYL